MADIQLENGYTKIANELLEVLAKRPLNGSQRRILDIVFRYTYGFNRKKHELSLSYIAKASNMNKQQVKRELDDLISQNIIKVISEADFRSSRVIEFNKNYDSWMADSKLIRVQSTNKSTLQSANQSTPTVSGLEYQEIKIKKTLKKDVHVQFFEELWSLYPNKKGKGKISNSQKAKLYKIGFEKLSRCIERYKKSKESWKAWQQGSTFFNTGYIDYLDENYNDSSLEPDQYREVAE